MTPQPPVHGLVDVHAHFVTPEYVAAARAAGIDRPDNMPGWPSWSVEAHLDVLDRAAVQKAILSISSPGIDFGVDESAARLGTHVNDFAAEVSREHPDRFGFFASLPLPNVDGALDEIERAFAMGATGVAIESSAGGTYLGDPSYAPVWAELNRRRAIVFVHPTSPPAAELTDVGLPRPMLEFIFDTTRTMTDLIVSDTLKKNPDVRVIAPHCGAALPFLAERIQFVLNVLDAAGESHNTPDFVAQLQLLWFDVAGFPMPTQVPALLSTVGPEHLLYGSDYCWTAPAGVDHQLQSLDEHWSEAQTPWRSLFTENARHLLTP